MLLFYSIVLVVSLIYLRISLAGTPATSPSDPHPLDWDERYAPDVRSAGLLALARIVVNGLPRMDGSALTALVDRWRPETHTFHLPSGEMTITLQDVGMILGLPVGGEPVTGDVNSAGWRDRVGEWLGVRPEDPPCGLERQQAICGACVMAARTLQCVPTERRCRHSGALRTGVDVASSWLLPLPGRYRQCCLLDLLADFGRFHDGRDLQLGFCYTGVSVPASVRCMPIRECGGQLGWLRIPPADLDVGAFPRRSTHSCCLAGTDFF